MKAASVTRARHANVVLLGVFVAVIVLLGAFFRRSFKADDPGAEPVTVGQRSDHEASFEERDGPITEVALEPGERSAIPERSPVAAAPPVDVQHVLEEGSPVDVRVLIEPNPWLKESTGSGTISFGTAQGRKESFPFRFDAPHAGEIELPSAPTSLDDFGPVHVAGLTAQVVGLTPLVSATGSVIEVHTAWNDGATLVWDRSVPLADQVLITVAVGGRVSPPSRASYGNMGRVHLVETRSGLRLPFTLPHLQRKELIWVGATGHQWRAFNVSPDVTEVEVELARSGIIHVLHDRPSDSSAQHVFVKSLPQGEMESVRIAGPDPILFTERPAASHDVWVAESHDRKSQRISRLARVEVVAGETVEVDLTSRYEEQQFGGLRVHIHTTKKILESADDRLRLEASRYLTSTEAARPWERAGTLIRIEDGSVGEPVYEMTGLAAGLHRVVMKPFGSRVTDQIVVGEMHDLDLFLDEVGWVEWDLPTEYKKSANWVALSTTEARPGDRLWISLETDRNRREKTARPVAPGTYVAHVKVLGGPDLPPLASDPFSIQAGKTTFVEFASVVSWKVHVDARDAATGKPIQLDLKFWVGVSAVNTTTGEAHLGITSFEGGASACTGIHWEFGPIDDPVRVTVPESPFWSFDDVEPLNLEDGSTVTLHAHRR